MAKKLDPRLLDILTTYGERPEEALWDCHGTWVAYHKAIERIAAKAGIWFDMPSVVEADAEKKIVSICVHGHMSTDNEAGEKFRSEWSFGEASPGNNKNAYPYAMAEKRAKDRVVLKLIGLHGLVYSEEESDDFKRNPPAPPVEDETYAPPPRRKNGLPEYGWRADGSRTSFWLKENGTAEELKAQLLEDAVDCHSLMQLEELKKFYRAKARELRFNKSYMAVLAEEFAAIERSIMNSLDAAELAEVPLETALKASVLNAG